MKAFVYFEDSDNSCSDPDCCGGPFPSIYLKIFSSLEKAMAAGYKEDDLSEMEIDSNEFKHI